MAYIQLRELGAFEQFRVVLHDLGYHNSVALVATLNGPNLEFSQLQKLAYHAVRHAMLEHPALRVSVTKVEDDKLCFFHLPEIDLTQLITIEDTLMQYSDKAAQLEGFLSKQNSTGFKNTELPLWRVIFRKYPSRQRVSLVDLTFVWHHVIGDGKSGLAVLASIMRGMSTLNSDAVERMCGASNSDELMQKVHTNADLLRPPLEEILSMRTSWLAQLWSTLKQPILLWGRSSPQDLIWSGAPYTYSQPVVTRIKCISLSAANLEDLIDTCRAQGTTITPLIQTLAAHAIFNAVPHSRSLRCAVAISLRRFFTSHWGISDKDIGLWVSTFVLDLSRTESLAQQGKDSFWHQVRKNGEHFQHEIAKGDADIAIGALRYIPDFRSWLMDKIGKPRENSCGITNIGVFHQPDNLSPWTLSSVVFSQSCHVNGSAIQVCVVSSKDGPLNIVLSWQDGVVDDALVREMAMYIERRLLELSEKE